jgi:hypothetical protein
MSYTFQDLLQEQKLLIQKMRDVDNYFAALSHDARLQAKEHLCVIVFEEEDILTEYSEEHALHIESEEYQKFRDMQHAMIDEILDAKGF